MSRFPDDREEIKQGLKDRIEELCRLLLNDGRRQGRLWVAHNPVTGDFSQTPEFKVALDRDKGAWIDWRSGDKGDVIRLVEYCRQCDFADAMRWARDFLGLRAMPAADRQRLAERAKRAAAEADETAAARRLERMRMAEQIWFSGRLDGSMSAAEAHARGYFLHRGIDLSAIANRDMATFRFSEAREFTKRAKWGRNADGRNVKLAPGPAYPAILTAMRLPTGQFAAVHQTYLDPSAPRKLPVDKGDEESAKIMFGEAKGAMIRISHGPEGEPPETAVTPQPLILCEGIEDGLTLALAVPEARVWAAGSLSNMANAPIWLPCVSYVVVARDNDWEKKQAVMQFEKVMSALSQHGKVLTEMSAHEGKDFNDVIMGE